MVHQNIAGNPLLHVLVILYDASHIRMDLKQVKSPLMSHSIISSVYAGRIVMPGHTSMPVLVPIMMPRSSQPGETRLVPHTPSICWNV